jgi:DNA-binding winged helix-turn-helix (wHTH) protein
MVVDDLVQDNYLSERSVSYYNDNSLPPTTPEEGTTSGVGMSTEWQSPIHHWGGPWVAIRPDVGAQTMDVQLPPASTGRREPPQLAESSAMLTTDVQHMSSGPDWRHPARPAVNADKDTGTGLSSFTVTVRIDLHGGELAPAAIELLESLRALAGAGMVSVGTRERPAPDASLPNEPNRAVIADPAILGAVARTRRVPPALLSGRAEVAGGGPSLEICQGSRRVWRDGAPFPLTRREYDLLAFLCEHPRRVFSRRELVGKVWGYEMLRGDRTVDMHVWRLRGKLGERGPVIVTVRGVGYRLDDVSQVTIMPTETASPTMDRIGAALLTARRLEKTGRVAV